MNYDLGAVADPHGDDGIDDDHDPESAIADVRRVRAVTRTSLLSAGWRTLLLWGVIMLGGSLMYANDPDHAGWYWAVAAPAGAIVSSMLGRRESLSARLSGSTTPYVLTSAIMLVGGFGPWMVLDLKWALLVWWLVIVGGIAVFAHLDRQRALVIALIGVIAWGLAISTRLPLLPTLIAMTSGLGGVLLGAGAAYRTVR